MFMLRKTILLAISGIIALTCAINVGYAAEKQSGLEAKSSVVVTPVEPSQALPVQHIFVGLQPHHKLHVQGYLIEALHFAHNSYGYVSWSMRAARRNLQEPLFEPQLQQLNHFIKQTIVFADLAINLTTNPEGLPEVKEQLEKQERAVTLMLEGNQKAGEASAPDEKVVESGKLHEEVGKALPELFAVFQKAMREQASATIQVNGGN
jgi:hypothetical protein